MENNQNTPNQFVEQCKAASRSGNEDMAGLSKSKDFQNIIQELKAAGVQHTGERQSGQSLSSPPHVNNQNNSNSNANSNVPFRSLPHEQQAQQARGR